MTHEESEFIGMGIATDHDEFGHDGGTVGPMVAWDLGQTFLAAEFGQAPRHLRRLGKVLPWRGLR